MNAFLERLAFDQFHRIETVAGLLANSELEDSGDVLVSQRRRRTGFAHKTFAGLTASPGEGEPDELQCNRALERSVDGAIGYAHRSMPKLVKASVRTALDLIDSKGLVDPESVRC